MERAAQLATVFIGLFALAAAMILTRDISAPMALAMALGVVLAPLSDLWERLGFSPASGALLSLFVTLVCMAGLLLVFQPIVVALVEAAPKVWRDLQDLLQAVRGLVRGMSDLSRDLSQAVAPAATAAPPAEAGPAVALPSVTDALWLAPAIVGQVLTFAGTLFFFLLSRGPIYDFVARQAAPENRAPMAGRLRAAERTVSRYFLTVTAINAAMGLATAGALLVIGLPNAALWGTLSFVLNFIVYLGPAILAVGLLFAGVAAFDGPLAFAGAAAFVTLNTLEGQFITPALVGRQTEINPLAVFVAIIFGLWIWGPVGGIVAIPLILWLRVLGMGQTAQTSAPGAAAARSAG